MDDMRLRLFDISDTDWLVERHAKLYGAAERFDETFGPLVREILTDFSAGHDRTCERGWIAEVAGQRIGSIFCVRQDAQIAKLRLFLLVPEARGKGIGRALLGQCMGFARDAGYKGMQLWTHESHRAACALYVSAGWTLSTSSPVHSFGQDLIEQTWIYRF